MKVVFPVDVYQKFRAYIESVRVEISGLGRISIHGQTIRIEEIKIFKQICMAGGTVLDKRDIGSFWDTLEDPSGWKLWWHSHGELQAYFSPTDHATIADFDNQTKEDNWQLSIVANRAEEMEIRIDFFSPFPYTIEKVPWEIDYIPRNLEDEVFEEVAQKVQIYQERREKSEKKKKTNHWDGGEGNDYPLLPAYSILGKDGKPISVHDIDPEDIARHPELFGIKGNGKK